MLSATMRGGGEKMEVIHVNASSFEAAVLKSAQSVIVDFWAKWCGPCQMLGPELEAIAASREDLKVVKVDVDESPALAAQYGVMSIPAVFLFRNGKVAASAIGYMKRDELLKTLGL